MIYDIIIIALALLIPAIAYKAWRSGYNTALRVNKGEPMPIIHPPEKSKPTPETDAQRKARILQSNIDNYGKPGYHQQEVK